MGVETDTSGHRFCRWRFGPGEIRHVVASPLGSVPPDPLLALAPRVPGRIGRSAVVQEPPVGRPGVAPIQLRAALAGRIGLLSRREILVRSREDAGVYPGRTRRGA